MEFKVQASGGNWWLKVNGDWMGYYPATLFATTGLRSEADRLAFGGEVFDAQAHPGTTNRVDWNTRQVTGDAVAEITRLKAEDGGLMGIGGATLAGAGVRAGLIDEYALATYPVLVGGGTSLFTALNSWVNLDLMKTRTFPGGVVLTRYETRR